MLEQANQEWHHALDAHYQTFLESLTALELGDAKRTWSTFKHSLEAHLGFEHAHIEPLAASLPQPILKLIEADHLIIERLLPRLDTALVHIEQSPQQRTQLVQELDTFIKLRNVLSHHDAREVEQLYPQLAQSVPSHQRKDLANAMNALRSKTSAE